VTTLIAVHNSHGCVGRCGARCYQAAEPDCDCICGGRNHGAGQAQAIGNTRELAGSWLEQARASGQDITRAELPAQVQPPTQDVIIRALGSIGIAEINKAIKDLAFPPLPAPVREDGPGWRAEVDLPYWRSSARRRRRSRPAGR
jgi:hypothetical protein